MLGLAFAMGTPPGGGAAGGASAFMNIVPLIFMFAIFYFSSSVPSRRRPRSTRRSWSPSRKGTRW